MDNLKKSLVFALAVAFILPVMVSSGCGPSAESYVDRGCNLDDEGKYDEAITEFSKAIELDPNYELAYYDRGTVYHKIGQYELAIDDFSMALEVDPDSFLDTYIYCNRGTVYYEIGRYELALDDYNEAIGLDSDWYGAWNGKGTVLEALGSYEEAMKCYNKALQLDPSNEKAQNNKDRLIAQGVPSVSFEEETEEVIIPDETEEGAPWQGDWRGTIEIVAWGSYNDGYNIDEGEMEAKGEFTFNINKDNEVSGNSTIQGSSSSSSVDNISDDSGTSLCNFESEFKINRFDMPLPGEKLGEPPGLSFYDLQPSTVCVFGTSESEGSSTTEYDASEFIFGGAGAIVYDEAGNVIGSKIWRLLEEDAFYPIIYLPPGSFPIEFEDGGGYEDQWDGYDNIGGRTVYRITIKIYETK
jgi:tetratricopeptide (TPR) repeat protein